MSENSAIKSDLDYAIAIYDEDASVVWKALKSLATPQILGFTHQDTR